jgi:hypothetical protein
MAGLGGSIFRLLSALGQSRHKRQTSTPLLVRFAPKATLALQLSE